MQAPKKKQLIIFSKKLEKVLQNRDLNMIPVVLASQQ